MDLRWVMALSSGVDLGQNYEVGTEVQMVGFVPDAGLAGGHAVIFLGQRHPTTYAKLTCLVYGTNP